MELDEKTILNYLSGNCTEEQLEMIDAWLDESPDNASRLFGMELALDLPQKKRFEDEAMIAAAEKKIMERVGQHNDAPRQNSTRRRNFLIRCAIAVSAAVIAACVFVFRDYYRTDHKSGNTISIAVAADSEVKEVALPDGSMVWLNSGSRIEYPSDFGSSNRSLYLEGECYFEVAHNEALPFVVKSPAMRVTVLGTTFNMSSRVADSTASVTLITGSVEVRGNSDEGQIVLTPSQRADIDMVSKRMTVRMVDAKLDAVWHDNLIPFHNASIFEIVKSLEQLYNVTISLSRELNLDSSYSGVIHRKKSITEVLDLLKNTIPISFSMIGDTILIDCSDD